MSSTVSPKRPMPMLQLLQMCPRKLPVLWSWSTTSFASFPQRWHGDSTGGGGYIFLSLWASLMRCLWHSLHRLLRLYCCFLTENVLCLFAFSIVSSIPQSLQWVGIQSPFSPQPLHGRTSTNAACLARLSATKRCRLVKCMFVVSQRRSGPSNSVPWQLA